INCSLCLGWYHCSCAAVPYMTAKRDDFDFVCGDCST
uniref:PHD-type domain-containing protein n=1 Tax=Amphimedon queenslandica TaxID=400682 RepID=A0A1X7SJ03_AMPQE